MTDFTINNEGTLVGIRPNTAAGREWVDENVQCEPWQYLGPTLYVDHRFAADIIDGIAAAGLTIN